MNSARKKVEERIYKVMDILDPTKANSAYYKSLFSKMSDEEFVKFHKRRLPLRFHHRPFEIEPNMSQIKKAADSIGVPLIEEVNLGYLYKDEDGNPVRSRPCFVFYGHIKRMKQSSVLKTHTGFDTSSRDMGSGRLTGDSKGGQMTDREFESLVALGLDNPVEEFARPKADAMYAKSVMNSIISNTGVVYLKDIPVSKEDSLSGRQLNSYLIGCHLKSNIIRDDNYFVNTIKEKERKVEREI